jgi:hypothetical protein
MKVSAVHGRVSEGRYRQYIFFIARHDSPRFVFRVVARVSEANRSRNTDHHDFAAVTSSIRSRATTDQCAV